MHVERFSDPQSIAQLRPAWNALAEGVPFRSYEWLMSWWNHYGADRQLYVLGIFDEERLIGLAPWYCTPLTSGGRTIRFLGDGDVCSDYLDILVDPQETQRDLFAQASFARRSRPERKMPAFARSGSIP